MVSSICTWCNLWLMLHYPEPPYWLSIVKSIIYMFSHICHAGQIYFLQVNSGQEGSWGLNHRHGAPQRMPLPLGYICECVCVLCMGTSA